MFSFFALKIILVNMETLVLVHFAPWDTPAPRNWLPQFSRVQTVRGELPWSPLKRWDRFLGKLEL